MVDLEAASVEDVRDFYNTYYVRRRELTLSRFDRRQAISWSTQ